MRKKFTAMCRDRKRRKPRRLGVLQLLLSRPTSLLNKLGAVSDNQICQYVSNRAKSSVKSAANSANRRVKMPQNGSESAAKKQAAPP